MIAACNCDCCSKNKNVFRPLAKLFETDELTQLKAQLAEANAMSEFYASLNWDDNRIHLSDVSAVVKITANYVSAGDVPDIRETIFMGGKRAREYREKWMVE